MAEKKNKNTLVKKIKKDNETGARRDLLEDLFYDFNKNRVNIYKINFVRGLFFGLGSVLGGTILVALLLWILNLFTGWFPALSDFISGITHTVQRTR